MLINLCVFVCVFQDEEIVYCMWNGTKTKYLAEIISYNAEKKRCVLMDTRGGWLIGAGANMLARGLTHWRVG